MPTDGPLSALELQKREEYNKQIDEMRIAIRDFAILAGALPQMSVIAEAQLQAQQQIAENTLRNAIAAEAIHKSSDSIHRLLSRVIAGAAKFYIK